MKHAFADKYSSLRSPIHSLDPRAKSLATFLYILIVVLTPVTEPAKYIAYLLVLMVTLALSRIPPIHIIKRIAAALPFVLLIVMFVPFFKEGETAGSIAVGPVVFEVTVEGLRIMTGVIVKSSLAVAALAMLVGSTRFSDLLKGLEKMHVPSIMVAVLAFMYRFIFVLTDDAQRLARAFSLRNFGGFRLRKIRAVGNMIGLLFIRTYERAERIFAAMVLRGYEGRTMTMSGLKLRARDALFFAAFAGSILAIRLGRF